MQRITVGFTGCALLAAVGCSYVAGRRFDAEVRNKPAPDFVLSALDGTKVRLSEQKGKPVVLAFFAYG
ncbi:MAG: redoxin domain-containing protein [Planctomycetes bacterium]|nr:redoxin domain-containing protein [Planctomycetota bacterium]